MFQSRWFNPVLQHPTLARPHLRASRPLARSLLIAASLAVLAACGPTPEDATEETAAVESDTRDVSVTAAFDRAEGGAAAVGFLPNRDAHSLGLIVSASRDGGLDFFDADGVLRTSHAGERITGLATAPGFQLRGATLPLVFGAAPDSNAVRGYAVVTDGIRILDLPLAATEPVNGVAGLCLFREGVGYVDLVILGTGADAEIWRVRDAGEDTLNVEQRQRLTLSAPARQCATLDGDIYLAGPASGITRIDANGVVGAETSTPVSALAVGDFNGSRIVLATDGNSGVIHSFYANDLSPAYDLTITDGLSTPGVAQPDDLALTQESYGFTAYASGMIAVFDRGDQRIKVISLDAAARGLVAAE
jgi:myo-inositol-hexaphosphate 3-phosphohydrolase